MHEISKSKIITHDMEKVYKIIRDIECYKDFLPWCDKISIVSVNNDEIIADVYVSYMGFCEKYRCVILCDKSDNEANIKVKYIDGPFNFLNCNWNIKSVDDNKTLVDFKINFEFKSKIMNKLSEIWLDYGKEKIMLAFEKRLSYIE